MISARHHRTDARGFSLIELLCAMVLFSLIGGALFLVLGNTNDTWTRAKERIDTRRSGRAIIGQIAAELEIASLPDKRNVHIASVNESPTDSGLSYQLLVNPRIGITQNDLLPNFQSPHSLFWQAPIDGEKLGGNPTLGYFIRWIPGANPRAMLCRFYVESGSSDYRIFSNPTNWLDEATINRVAPGVLDTGTPSQSYRGWFADNVIGLWVRCYDPLGNRIEQDALERDYGDSYDSRLGYSYKRVNEIVKRTVFVRRDGAFNVKATLPFSAEIGLVVLDEKHAKRLQAIPDYDKVKYFTEDFKSGIQAFIDDLPDAVRPGAKAYTTRINFINSQ